MLQFHFDESAGATNFTDASGNGNTGTCGVSCPKGEMNGVFDSSVLTSGATGNYVSVASAASLNVTNITISDWVSLTSAQVDGCVATKGYGGGEVWRLDTSGNNFRFYFWKGGAAYVAASSYNAFKAGWTHVVATYDGVNEIVYINGISNVTNNANQGNLGTNASVISIGARQSGNGSTFNYTNGGLFDELALYNRALTRSEGVREYKRGYARLARKCEFGRRALK